MITFRSYLINEAFNFRPKSETEIDKKVKNSDQLQQLFRDLKNSFPEEDELITVDKKIGKAKILRKLKNKVPKEIINKHKKILTSDIYGNGSTSKNMNSLGRKLADAGELATILSLTKDIRTPEDTKQQIFIDNPEAFNKWKKTFDETKKAVNKIVGDLSKYYILHDATDKSDFAKVISKFTRKIGIAKDSWNPADVFIVSKSKFKQIVKRLNTIIDENNGEDLVKYFNYEIYDLYTKKLLFPISLKQISNTAKIEYSNEPGNELKFYNIQINKFNMNFTINSGTTKEIGLFLFDNKDTDKQINMQVRGFPFGFTTVQTEITNDGTETGGRLGKVPTKVIDYIMGQYNFERIKTTKYFGTRDNKFKNLTPEKLAEIKYQYDFVSKHPKTQNDTQSNVKELLDTNYLNELSDYEKDIFVIKVQGLRFMYFFLKNEKEIAKIVNELIYGAKKINPKAGFFIKIY